MMMLIDGMVSAQITEQTGNQLSVEKHFYSLPLLAHLCREGEGAKMRKKSAIPFETTSD